MRCIKRETTAYYDCGNMEPQSVPEGEGADIVIAFRGQPDRLHPKARRIAYHWLRDDRGNYFRTAGPADWLAAGDDQPTLGAIENRAFKDLAAPTQWAKDTKRLIAERNK